MLGGLWHGANWTFVVWGVLHGVYLTVERIWGIDRLDRSGMSLFEKWARGVVTFHLVCLAWVFFRAPTATFAFDVIKRIVTLAPGESVSGLPLLWLGAILAVQIAKARVDVGGISLRFPHMARWAAYVCLFLLIRVLIGGPSPEFIYFQF